MQEIQINLFNHFIDIILSENACGHWIYRGVTDQFKHKLIPTIGRLQVFKNNNDFLEEREYEFLNKFKLQTSGIIDYKPYNDLEWLTLAQHHRLPMRSLDCSTSPLVAAYFLVNISKNDG